MNEDLINRITYHLSSGGLFNPELADHLAVRNLLMECRDALAQPEQEPVGYWMGKFNDVGAARLYEVPQESVFGRTYRNIPVYTTLPKRKPLTDEEIDRIWGSHTFIQATDRRQQAFARAIEAAHGIKGEA